MGAGKANAWIGATTVLVLVVLGLGWLAVVSPQLAEASAADEERQQVEFRNATLRDQNDALKAQFAQLDELKADLDDLRIGIPATAERAALLRQIEATAAAHEVVITSVLASNAVVVDTTLPVVETPATEGADDAVAEDVDGSAEDGSTDGSTSSDAAPAPGEPVLPGFYSLPVSVTVQGAYANTRAFMESLQQEIDRLFLVTTFAATSLLQSEGSADAPPSALGDVELTVSGLAYVLEGPDSESAPEDATDEGPLPEGTGINPFMPVGGSDAAAPEGAESP